MRSVRKEAVDGVIDGIDKGVDKQYLRHLICRDESELQDIICGGIRLQHIYRNRCAEHSEAVAERGRAFSVQSV